MGKREVREEGLVRQRKHGNVAHKLTFHQRRRDEAPRPGRRIRVDSIDGKRKLVRRRERCRSSLVLFDEVVGPDCGAIGWPVDLTRWLDLGAPYEIELALELGNRRRGLLLPLESHRD